VSLNTSEIAEREKRLREKICLCNLLCEGSELCDRELRVSCNLFLWFLVEFALGLKAGCRTDHWSVQTRINLRLLLGLVVSYFDFFVVLFISSLYYLLWMFLGWGIENKYWIEFLRAPNPNKLVTEPRTLSKIAKNPRNQ